MKKIMVCALGTLALVASGCKQPANNNSGASAETSTGVKTGSFETFAGEAKNHAYGMTDHHIYATAVRAEHAFDMARGITFKKAGLIKSLADGYDRVLPAVNEAGERLIKMEGFPENGAASDYAAYGRFVGSSKELKTEGALLTKKKAAEVSLKTNKAQLEAMKGAENSDPAAIAAASSAVATAEAEIDEYNKAKAKCDNLKKQFDTAYGDWDVYLRFLKKANDLYNRALALDSGKLIGSSSKLEGKADLASKYGIEAAKVEEEIRVVNQFFEQAANELGITVKVFE